MLSSHVYWNLDGYGAEEEEQGLGAMNHTLKIASSSWIGTDGILVSRFAWLASALTEGAFRDEELITDCLSHHSQVPTGQINPISKGSGMDFRTARPVGDRIDQMKGKCGSGELSILFP